MKTLAATFILLLSAGVASAQEAPVLPDSTPFTVASGDLREGEVIPDMYVSNANGCDGMNISPVLTWSYPPEGTQSFAVTMFDETARQRQGLLHWFVLNIPAEAKVLVRGVGTGAAPLPEGAVVIPNWAGHAAYDGPCPQPGDKEHHYFYTVYAMPSQNLEYPLNSIGWSTLDWLDSIALAKDTIEVTYQRPTQ